MKLLLKLNLFNENKTLVKYIRIFFLLMLCLVLGKYISSLINSNYFIKAHK